MKRSAAPSEEAPTATKKVAWPARVDLRMVEFFSGIGGMRSAVEGIVGKDVHLSSCMAFEISQTANEVYRHNFPDTAKGFGVRTKLVEQLRVTDLPKDTNLWTMSPPCQPFTRTRLAKQRDLDDKRTAGFVAVLNLLEAANENRPMWILLENVAGFAGSQAHELFYKTLLKCGYSWIDGVLSPIELGVPNHRKRYFALCEKSDRFFRREEAVFDKIPHGEDSLKEKLQTADIPVQNLSEFIDFAVDATDLMIPDSILDMDWAKHLPVVSHLDTQSHCFTAAYSRQIHTATGSLLLMDPSRKESIEQCPMDRSNMKAYKGKLRRFSSVELLKLFGFPDTFTFPSTINQSHQHKLIGNSISVVVVKEILRYLVKR